MATGLALWLLLAAAPPRAGGAVPIDGFTNTGGKTTDISDDTVGGVVVSINTGLTGVVGASASREVRLSKASGSLGLEIRARWNPPDNVISIGAAPGASGSLSLFYDGDGTLGDTGDLNVDLTQGAFSSSALLAIFTSSDHATDATATLTGGAVACSLTRSVPAAPEGATVAFPFDSFAGCPDVGAVFASTDTITFTVDAPASTDLTLTEIRVDLFTPPAAPTITDTDPDSPAADNHPEVKGTVGGGSPTTVGLHKNSNCSGSPDALGTVAEFTGPGITVPVDADVVTTLSARVSDAGGNGSSCSSPFGYTHDATAPPTPAITGTAPASPANDDNPEAIGTAGGDAALVRIYRDDALCVDPFPTMATKAQFEGAGITVPVAENATTQLRARAVDQAGNMSACSSAFAYTDDSLAPETMIDAGPPATTQKRRPKFRFSASEPGTFACRLDGGPFAPCTSPFRTPRLSLGKHTFRVGATDEAENPDPTPAKDKFKVVRT